MKRVFQLILLLIISTSFSVDAKVYDFQSLYQQLGYPSPNNFGATEDQYSDLETYTSKEDAFYREINDYLRYFPKQYEWTGTSPEVAKSMVKNIDHIFDLVPELPTDLILFRGLSLKFRKNKNYKTGEEFVEKAYISTSTSFKVAHYFAVEMNAEDRKTSRKAILVIYSAKPKLKGILFDQGEDEVVLKHGEKIRIMAMKNTGEAYNLYLAQICGKVCAHKIDGNALRIFNNIN